MDVEGERPDYEDTAWLSNEILAYFTNYVLLNLAVPIVGVSVSGDTDLTFNARVTTANFTTFRIILNNGCLARIYEALDVTSKQALEPLIDVASSLFGGPGDYDLTCRVFLNFAILFILFHEYAHIAAGHLDAQVPVGTVSGTETTFRWDEVPGPANCLDLALSVPDVASDEVRKVFELEADSTSYELLLDFAVDILLASEEARLSLPSVNHAADLDPDQARGLQQLIFYACALTVSLTEWSRLDAGVQGIYPSAAARMMSLYLTLFRRQLPSDWRVEGMEHVTRITGEGESAVVDFIVPTMSRAFDLCETCCANVRREIGSTEPLPSKNRKGFADDLAALLDGRSSKTVTATGQELTALQSVRLAILGPMRSLRRSNWWDVPDAS